MYPPVVIVPGGKYPGKEWNPSNIEIDKDQKAAKALKISRIEKLILVLHTESGNVN